MIKAQPTPTRQRNKRIYPCTSRTAPNCLGFATRANQRCHPCYYYERYGRPSAAKAPRAPKAPPEVRRQIEQFIAESEPEIPPQEEDPERVFAEWERIYEREKLRKPKKKIPEFDLGTRPVAIANLGDGHIGPASETDYPALFRHVRLIRDTPGLYAQATGDMFNNFIKGKLAHANGKDMPIDWQWRTGAAIFRSIAGSLLAVVGGNHELWTMALAGIDRMRALCRDQRLLYRPHGLRMILKVGSVRYKVETRHKFWGTSKLNPTNPFRNLFTFRSAFDIGFLGHTHQGVIGSSVLQDLPRYFLLAGCYKVEDDYANMLGFAPPRPMAPTAILMADKREIIPFESIEHAARYLTYLRGSHANE